jgi:predicted transcriptional regulator
MKTSVVTARLDDETLTTLDRLAAHHERSRAWLVTKAIKHFVEKESAFLAFLQEGEDAIDRGDFVTHEELVAEIRAMRSQKHAA